MGPPPMELWLKQNGTEGQEFSKNQIQEILNPFIIAIDFQTMLGCPFLSSALFPSLEAR